MSTENDVTVIAQSPFLTKVQASKDPADAFTEFFKGSLDNAPVQQKWQRVKYSNHQRYQPKHAVEFSCKRHLPEAIHRALQTGMDLQDINERLKLVMADLGMQKLCHLSEMFRFLNGAKSCPESHDTVPNNKGGKRKPSRLMFKHALHKHGLLNVMAVRAEDHITGP